MTAVCHYNYEYSNIFPADLQPFANHCSKPGVLSISYILRRDFFTQDSPRGPSYLGTQLLLRMSCLSAPVKFPAKETREFVLTFQKLGFETKQLFGIWGLNFMSWYASFNITMPNQQLFVGILLPVILLCPNTRMCWDHHPHRSQSWNTFTQKYGPLLLQIKRLCPSAQRKQQIHKSLQCGPDLGYIEPPFITESYSSVTLLYVSEGFTHFSTFTLFNDNSSSVSINSRCI